MRQQLVSWLIEDIAPEIRRTSDPEGTIIKFANQHNLAPALVQSLGQMFNTAKTLAYVERSTEKGASFPLLDVPAMLDKYLAVHTKSASATYVEVDENSNELPEFFQGIIGIPVALETTVEEKPVKMASVREQLKMEDDIRRSRELIDQVQDDFEHEAREMLAKSANLVRQGLIDFAQLESDALALYGDSIRPSVNALANFSKSASFDVPRAKDAGGDRLIRTDHQGALPMLVKVAEVFEKIKVLKELRGDNEKMAASLTPPPTAEKDAPAKPAPQDRGNESFLGRALSLPGKAPKAEPKVQGKSAPETAAPRGDKKAPDRSYLSETLGSIPNPVMGASMLGDKLRGALGEGRNDDQAHVDSAYQDAVHSALLQNLLTTDDVLADADPEHVANMYNTLRQLSPAIASDPNIARVALRTMIQHDGVSPFDAKSMLDTEQSHQKVDFNRQLLDSMRYGGGKTKPSAKPM